MTNANWINLGIGGYIGLYGIAVTAYSFWKIRQRKLRPPLEFKLLRGPGETLRRRMATFDENLPFGLLGAALFPFLVASPTYLWLVVFKPTTWPQFYAWLTTFCVCFLFGIWFSFRWAVRKIFRQRNDRLGYLGERAVGESVLSLPEAGYKVFHDVPADAGGHDFNVDHVAVGPAGVFAIETKTRRKGRARPGFEDHKVAYDGRQLIWPWGEDDFGLQNAENRARWLTDWLNKMTGLGLAAIPVLVFPGWYVAPKGMGPVIVVNHKQLAGTILRQPRGVLTGEQVELIARQLDAVCRDVED